MHPPWPPRPTTRSIHQAGRTLYPGSGFPSESGGPNAQGKTVNIPLPPQTGEKGFLYTLDELVMPILEEFKQWLDTQIQDGCLLPKSAIAGAIRYALNHWESLLSFTEDGRLPIDNNDTERDLRRLTIGRKNWLFIGSSAAGDVAARMYTLIASASRHQLDLWAYVDDVLRRLAGGESDMSQLAPDRWAAEHPESIRTYRQAEQEARRAKTKVRRARQRNLAARQR